MSGSINDHAWMQNRMDEYASLGYQEDVGDPHDPVCFLAADGAGHIQHREYVMCMYVMKPFRIPGSGSV